MREQVSTRVTKWKQLWERDKKKTLQRLLKPPLQTAGALLQLQILQKIFLFFLFF